MPNYEIRPVEPNDLDGILAAIKGLAEFERLSHEVFCTADDLNKALFGPEPGLWGLAAVDGEKVLGSALYCYAFSTFKARKLLYLEDLYIPEANRGQGIGKALFAALAKLALENDCSGMRWMVLDWNQPAIDFYHALGGGLDEGWLPYGMNRAAMDALAGTGGVRS